MEDLKMGMILNLPHHLLCTELLVLVIFMVCFPAAIILKKKTTKSAMLFSSLVDMASLYLPTVSVLIMIVTVQLFAEPYRPSSMRQCGLVAHL